MNNLEMFKERTDRLAEKIEQESTSLCAFGIAIAIATLLMLVIVLIVI